MSAHEFVSTVVLGGNALSDFRAAALLRRLQEVAPEVSGVRARYVHWVASQGTLSQETAGALTRILTYGEPYDESSQVGALVVVAPRLGTISPWASKATDIVHNCGIDIHRVERVTEYRLEQANPEQANPEQANPEPASSELAGSELAGSVRAASATSSGRRARRCCTTG